MTLSGIKVGPMSQLIAVRRYLILLCWEYGLIGALKNGVGRGPAGFSEERLPHRFRRAYGMIEYHQGPKPDLAESSLRISVCQLGMY